MPVHTGRLLLTPQDPFLLPDGDALCRRLADAGFLAAPLAGREGAYLAGARFLDLILFTGCAIQIALTPPADGDGPFCHVRIAGPHPSPVFVSGRNTRPPRCPSCRAPLRDWRGRLSSPVVGDIPCATCGEAAPPWGWDWKEGAGWGRLFIQIEEVFPGEARPAPRLMDLLREGSGGAPWRYFYAQDP